MTIIAQIQQSEQVNPKWLSDWALMAENLNDTPQWWQSLGADKFCSKCDLIFVISLDISCAVKIRNSGLAQEGTSGKFKK
jgi:hypothetical protein